MKPLLLALLPSLLAVAAQAAPDERFDAGTPVPAPRAEPAAPAPGKALNSDERVWVVVEAPSKSARNALVEAGVSIEEVMGSRVGGVAAPKALAKLKALGVPYISAALKDRFGELAFPAEDSPFHDYAETEAALRGLAAAAPELASLFSIGKSHGGKALHALRLNSSAKGYDEPSKKPGIIFLGTHHAREHLSTEVPLLIAKHLVENRAKPEIARLLATRDIYFVPMVNPDGVEYDLRGDTYHMHRKNLRDNKDGSVGVDLNRNYDFRWCQGGASRDTESDTYCGPSAFSEPETQAVRDFVRSRKDNVKILLSYHTFSELILYPWGGADEDIPNAKDLATYKAMAGEMGKMTGYRPQKSSDLYVATGDTTDWSYGELGIFSFTFELTPKSMWSGGFYPGAKAIAPTVAANIRPALYLIDLADDPHRASGRAPDALTAVPASTNAGGR